MLDPQALRRFVLPEDHSGAGPDFRQAFSYGRWIEEGEWRDDAFHAVDHPRDLFVVTSERTDEGWASTPILVRADFEVELVRTRGPNEFYVVGTDERGDAVVERWILEWPLGAPSVGVRLEDAASVGTPLADELWIATGTVGDVPYRPPGERSPPRVHRRVLLRTDDFGDVVDLTVDLHGRWVALLGSVDASVVQVVASDPPVVHVLADAGHDPFLATCDTVLAFADPDQGRGLYVGRGGEFTDELALFLWDADNDGVFDGRQLLPDHAAWYGEDSPIEWNHDLTALGYEFRESAPPRSNTSE
ncbi:MAG: hypothetical protein R3F34_16030 [Planctomycetota bacterium]